MEQNAVRSIAVTSVERLVRGKKNQRSHKWATGKLEVRPFDVEKKKPTTKYWEKLMKINLTNYIKFTER